MPHTLTKAINNCYQKWGTQFGIQMPHTRVSRNSSNWGQDWGTQIDIQLHAPTKNQKRENCLDKQKRIQILLDEEFTVRGTGIKDEYQHQMMVYTHLPSVTLHRKCEPMNNTDLKAIYKNLFFPAIYVRLRPR